MNWQPIETAPKDGSHSEWLRGLAKEVDELRNSAPATQGEG